MPISEPSAGPGTAGREFADAVAARVRECRDRIAAARRKGGHQQDVVLVAVTKTHGIEAVEAAYHAGVHDIGENKVQEADAKRALVSLPVRWHLIGHLQRNKARRAVHADLFHALDSERLAAALQQAASEAAKTLDVLVQVNISGEESKSGVAPSELPVLCDALHRFPALKVRGVMTMAPFEADERTLRTVFGGARDAGRTVASAGHPAEFLSMGMSGDFEIAVEEGATHVRLGTVLFGDRS